jgi:hypothetical protein
MVSSGSLMASLSAAANWPAFSPAIFARILGSTERPLKLRRRHVETLDAVEREFLNATRTVPDLLTGSDAPTNDSTRLAGRSPVSPLVEERLAAAQVDVPFTWFRAADDARQPEPRARLHGGRS